MTFQARSLREALAAFRSSHASRFVRHEGGDYPVELGPLHTEYVQLVTTHIEAELGRHGFTFGLGREPAFRRRRPRGQGLLGFRGDGEDGGLFFGSRR